MLMTSKIVKLNIHTPTPMMIDTITNMTTKVITTIVIITIMNMDMIIITAYGSA